MNQQSEKYTKDNVDKKMISIDFVLKKKKAADVNK